MRGYRFDEGPNNIQGFASSTVIPRALDEDHNFGEHIDYCVQNTFSGTAVFQLCFSGTHVGGDFEDPDYIGKATYFLDVPPFVPLGTRLEKKQAIYRGDLIDTGDFIEITEFYRDTAHPEDNTISAIWIVNMQPFMTTSGIENTIYYRP